jgi:hypothetical protein
MLNLQAAPLVDYQHCTQPPTALKTYEHRVGSPCNGHFKPTSPVVSQTGAQNVSKEDLQSSGVSPTQWALQAYLTGTIANRHSKLPRRRPTSIQRVPQAMGAFRKEDIRPSSVSPMQRARFKSHQQFVASGPFQGQQLPGCVRVTTAENSRVSP